MPSALKCFPCLPCPQSPLTWGNMGTRWGHRASMCPRSPVRSRLEALVFPGRGSRMLLRRCWFLTATARMPRRTVGARSFRLAGSGTGAAGMSQRSPITMVLSHVSVIAVQHGYTATPPYSTCRDLTRSHAGTGRGSANHDCASVRDEEVLGGWPSWWSESEAVSLPYPPIPRAE